MTIVRRAQTDLDETKLLADLASNPAWTEAEIDAMAAEDDSVATASDLGEAVKVYPPPTPEQVRSLRARRAGASGRGESC